GASGVGCDQFKVATDRALLSLSQIGVSCPDPVEGRAVGTETADGAFGCFGKAVSTRSRDLLIRVVCSGKTTATCRQTDETRSEADKTLTQLSKLSWTSGVLGSWNESESVTVYAVDNQGNDKRVSAVTI